MCFTLTYGRMDHSPCKPHCITIVIDLVVVNVPIVIGEFHILLSGSAIFL